MSDPLDKLAAHEFGYVHEIILDLLRRSAAGEHVAHETIWAAMMDFRHWEGITPADVPMVTALQVGPGGAPRELADEVERAADAQARKRAAEWLATGPRWLLPLLHHAGATVTLAPKHFGYTFARLQPPAWIPIAWLSAAYMPQDEGAAHAPGIPNELDLTGALANLEPIVEPLPAISGPVPVITWHQFGEDGLSPDLSHDPQRLASDLRIRRTAVAIAAALDLVPLLQEAAAVLFALPGRLFFSLPASPLPWIEIPGAGRFLDAAVDRASAH